MPVGALVRRLALAAAHAAALLVAGAVDARLRARRCRAKRSPSGFDSGIRNLVIEWDPHDTRPEAERRKALFDFIYRPTDASAWIPQSLFDSNLVTQAIVGDVDTIVGEKVGLVLWRDNALVPAFGMAPNVDGVAEPRQPLRWTVNCLVCHTAEIDGVAYFGAGTKTFDELWLGEALKRLTSDQWRGWLPRGPATARAGRRRQPDSQQPSPRQDRFAHPRAVHGVRGIARRAVHAGARQQDAGGRARSAAATSRRRRCGTRRRRCRSGAGTRTAASTARFR